MPPGRKYKYPSLLPRKAFTCTAGSFGLYASFPALENTFQLASMIEMLRPFAFSCWLMKKSKSVLCWSETADAAPRDFPEMLPGLGAVEGIVRTSGSGGFGPY